LIFQHAISKGQAYTRMAHDTEATVREAAELWKIIDRPNLYIKIPATPAGMSAITATVAEGISVNPRNQRGHLHSGCGHGSKSSSRCRDPSDLTGDVMTKPRYRIGQL
jgi:hypothetical protein